MCMSCGCKMPNEDHGDQRNITMNELEDAARASNISVDEVVRNIQETSGEMTGGQEGAGARGSYQRAYGREQEGSGPSV